ncbi:MAG: glycosyltransferase, partial [Bacteroidaceae bacterium]|nr:glycosyltransferase [Bacteroidaceae bacterium]
MNSEKILSIIVPTYNMEALLEKDLQSLVVADGLDSLEVLVINDGSKDKSSEIAHKFSAAYPNTFVVVDKPNGNYGSCINAGLKIAKGKYIKVMDADDSFDTKNFELFLKHLSQIDVDLVFNDYVKTYTSGKEISYTFDLPPMQVLKIEDVYNTQALYDILLPAITYRTEMLRELG